MLLDDPDDPVVGGVMGVEEPDCGMSVSSVCIVVVCEEEATRLVAITWTMPATADGAIRKGIVSSIGWK